MTDPFVRQRNEYVAARLEEQFEAKIQERIRAAETEAWNAAVETCAQVSVNIQDGVDAIKNSVEQADYARSMGDIIAQNIRKQKKEPTP